MPYTALTVPAILPYEKYLEQQDPEFELVGRHREISDISHILVQKHANNVLLYGRSGVGLSACVKGLTTRKSGSDMPLDIVGLRFRWLDVNGLFSLSSDEEISTKFREALRSLEQRNCVLVIDDMRDFCTGVRNMSDPHLFNLLMSGLKRRKFQMIAVTRKDSLGEVLDMHSDINEMFTQKEIKEPDAEEIEEIVRGCVHHFEKHHGITVSDAAIEETVALTEQYRGVQSFTRAQPTRSLNLIDLAASDKRLYVHSRPAALPAMEEELAALGDDNAARRAELEKEIERVNADWEAKAKRARELYEEMRKAERAINERKDKYNALWEQEDRKSREFESKAQEARDRDREDRRSGGLLKDLQDMIGLDDDQTPSTPSSPHIFAPSFVETEGMQKLRDGVLELDRILEKVTSEFNEMMEASVKDVVLEAADIKEKFSELSGIQLQNLDHDEKERLLTAENIIGERVMGQDTALAVVCDAVRSAKAGLKNPKEPMGTFMFLGPSGVGKTELAKALAEFLHGDESALIRIDMSEYMEQSQVSRLTGAAPGLVGYEEGGALTNAVSRNPYSVVLFDEIEKAHPRVFDILLQVLDDGRLTDNKGVTVDFRNTLICCTTNFGAHNFLDPDMSHDEAVKLTEDQMFNNSNFRPEFLNRFTNRIFFKPLTIEAVRMIAKLDIRKLNDMISERNLEVRVSDDDLGAFCAAHFQQRYGYRGVKNAIKSHVRDRLARAILESSVEDGGVISLKFIEKNQSIAFTIEAR